MQKFLLCLFTLCLCSYECHLVSHPAEVTVAVANQTTPAKDISSILQPIVEKYKIPGIAAAIINDKEVIAVGVAGVRARNSNKKILLGDLFHIGSDTKSMTATMIAMLVEKKLLKWDTRVVDVFPELKEKINPGFKDATLEQFLTHRSGVAANLSYNKIQKKANNNLIQTRQIILERALAKPPEVTPGKYLYSNAGYVIAGHMAEKVTGQSWENLMSSMLFVPLHMNTAGFGPPGNFNLLTQPVGHDEQGNPIGTDNPSSMGPAGTVHLSILDWAKYIMFHLNGARGTPRLLQLSSFHKLHNPISQPPPAYAMGWIVEDSKWAQGKVLVHAGSNTYWFAKVWIAPSRNLAILVACNDGSSQAHQACNEAALVLMQSQLHLPNIKSMDPHKAKDASKKP